METQLGVTQWTMPCREDDCVKMASELGLDCVHIDLGSCEEGYPMSSREKQRVFCREAREAGMYFPALSLNDFCEHGMTRANDASRAKIARETINIGVAAACEMGISAVTIPSFFDNAILGGDDYSYTVEGLCYACEKAKNCGVEVYTENALAPETLERLFNDVGYDNLKLLFDTQNYKFFASLDAKKIYLRFKDRMGDFMHLKDGEQKLGDRALGQGNSDFDTTFAQIVKDDYSGCFVLENNYSDADRLRREIGEVRRRIALLREGAAL